MAMTTAQIRESITSRIIKALESGVRPWVRPWSSDPNSGHPLSLATGKKYNGINPLLLEITSLSLGYSGRHWGTFNQWKNHGACVKGGEKATWIVLYKTVRKERQEDGKTEVDVFPIMKMYPVFCIDQVSGADHLRPAAGTNTGTIDYSYADAVAAATGVEIIHGGDRACFSTTSKQINMPWKSSFVTEESYYCTLFHELSHWSDDKLGSKLAWKRWGDDDYAFNELVAEISSCFLCSECRIPSGKRDDSISYIDVWLKKMKGDASYILKAASRASQTSDYVMGFSRPGIPAETEMETSEA